MSEVAPIEEITLNDLDPRLRKQVENARKNLSKNPTYAVEVCVGILQRHPGCVEVRKVLREAQRRINGGKNAIASKLKTLSALPLILKLNGEVKKDPQAALISAEKIITQAPDAKGAHQALAKAAEALGMKETTVFGYQCVHEIDPKDSANQQALGTALIESGDPQAAVQLGDSILRDHPASEAGQDLVRRASVALSMQKGKWEQEGGFRDKLANETEAIELEQAARVVNDDETVEKLVQRNLELLEKEPENLNLYREIISGYRAIANFDKALHFTKKARQTASGKADPTLDRLEVDLAQAQMRAQVQEIEQKLSASPEDAALNAQLEEIRQKEHQFRLTNTRRIVEKYPNDYAARFELGNLLFADGNYDEAIQQFQLAQRNPKVRVRAILMLGKTFIAKGIFDMAVEQLEHAKKELTLMDETKKEVIYELAQAHEKNKNTEKAIAEYKIIYSNDIGYRDVAEKINSFYASKQA